MTSSDVIRCLRSYYKEKGYMCFEELRLGTGNKGNSKQRMDFYAIDPWPSHRYHGVGFEIKVSIADFRAELRNPKKREAAQKLCSQFFFCAPTGLLDVDDIPADSGFVTVNPFLSNIIFNRQAPLYKPKATWNFLASVMRRCERYNERKHT